MTPTLINGRWSLDLPEERAARPGWSWWEQDTLAYLHAVIRPGDVVWDVGAEIGDFSCLYASWGARVVCIEADPQAVAQIAEIARANGVRLECVIEETVGDGTTGVGLDTIVAPAPDLICMDIEGAEMRALAGAECLLREVRPMWMISVHPEMMRDQFMDTPDDVLCHMETRGYSGHRIAYDHEHHWIFKPNLARP